MFNKLLLLISLCFITAMTGLAFYTEKNYDQNLLIAAHKADAGSSADVEILDTINEEEFMLSYQRRFSAVISTEQKNWDVEIKATNYTLPYVWQYPMTSGGFFTKEHQEQSNKVAVLNKLAAFELFGGYDITSNEIMYKTELYSVVGVIDDGDEKSKTIYIPITCTEYKPDLIAAVMDDASGIPSEYIKNELKKAGITENFDFIDVAGLSHMPRKTAALSLIISALLLCIWIIIYSIKNLLLQGKKLKINSKNYYFYELISNHLNEVLKFFAFVCSMIIFSVLLLKLTIQFANIFLGWRLKLFHLFKNSFHIGIYEIEFLGNLNLYFCFCFFGFILVTAILVWSLLKKSS